jgi:tRNA (cmo5U34)-methyltransferase
MIGELFMPKSTVEQIRQRFDNDVERFSNLETGQSATMDSPLCLELIARCAAKATPAAKAVLDIGCGAGNYTLRLLQERPGLDCTLLDLSRPMLDRAKQRVSAATTGVVRTVQADIREAALADGLFDIILASAVLHHLRTEAEWRSVYRKLFDLLRPGGSVWVFDMIEQSIRAVGEVMSQRFAAHLVAIKDESYRDAVFAYVEQEDTPSPLMFQLDCLRAAGFSQIDIVHKNGPFAAFGAVKDRPTAK